MGAYWWAPLEHDRAWENSQLEPLVHRPAVVSGASSSRFSAAAICIATELSGNRFSPLLYMHLLRIAISHPFRAITVRVSANVRGWAVFQAPYNCVGRKLTAK